MKNTFGILWLCMLTTACSTASQIYASLWNPETPEMQRTAIVDADMPAPIINDRHYVNDACRIGLQNPSSRHVVYCRNTFLLSAEGCARKYEDKGYVRFRDIPYKTANYDFLKVDSYPSRRWRDHEITPRW